MSEIEIASLKEEIARLNKLITILIEQNDTLKERIAFANIGGGNPKVPLASAKITNGNSEVPLAFAKVTNGNPETPLAVDKITNGNTEIPLASAKVTNGNPESPLAVDNITRGNTEVPLALTKVTNGNTNALYPLPAFLTLNNENTMRLRNILKKEGFNKVRKSGVRNAALLLLHFYNKGRGDYTELRKLTGHSNFGLAKYLRSLKKRGLIERDGWQKFKLTAHAVGLIQRAGCTS